MTETTSTYLIIHQNAGTIVDMLLDKVSSNKSFGGELIKYKFKVIIPSDFCKRCTNTPYLVLPRISGFSFPVCCTWRTGRQLQSLFACKCSRWQGPCSCVSCRIDLYWRQRVRITDFYHIIRAYAYLVRFSAQKGGFLRDAASQGIAILFPDTSPRRAGVEGEDDDWDFGTGI